jgi:hypothetical protein
MAWVSKTPPSGVMKLRRYKKHLRIKPNLQVNLFKQYILSSLEARRDITYSYITLPPTGKSNIFKMTQILGKVNALYISVSKPTGRDPTTGSIFGSEEVFFSISKFNQTD